MVGGCGAAAATASVNAGRIGSIIGEWKACEVRSRFTFTFLPSPPVNSASSSSGPATTHVPGPFTVAIDRPSGSSGAISASGTRDRRHRAGRQRRP